MTGGGGGGGGKGGWVGVGGDRGESSAPSESTGHADRHAVV